MALPADKWAVFKQPLALHSTRPLTGYTRTGYCEAPQTDFGNHSVAGTPAESCLPPFSCVSWRITAHHAAGIVTNEFLDFSASRGNDLRQAGLTDGCKWCLCASRWKEAFDARTSDSDKKVPKVVLRATNERALEGVKLEDLRRFAVDRDENGTS